MGGHILGTADIIALVAMVAAYALYLLVFCAITIGVSARFSAARTSLVALRGVWVVATLLAPRGAPALAESLDPTPTAPAFRAAVTEDAENGADGHDPADKRLDALRAEMLARYQVSDVDDLPVNFRGVALEFAEANSSETYNRHFERIYTAYQRQENTQRAFAGLSPTLALQAASRALARTDFPAHLAFLRGVEDYRYRLIQALNLEVKQHKAPTAAVAGPDRRGTVGERRHSADLGAAGAGAGAYVSAASRECPMSSLSIAGHEIRRLLRDRALPVLLGLLVVLAAYAAWNGSAWPGGRWQGAVGTAPGPAGAPSRPDGGIVDWTGRSLPLYRRRGCAG
ncbi:hypothetical protein G6F31_014730 [Rhizopus arrhizus]|nr:hypothetical protein G6F31_014730 [Rhizopus arrhizus]